MRKVVVLFLLLSLVTSGCMISVKKEKDLTDAEKFSTEYTISKSNPFIYLSSDELIDILQNGTGIIFFGNSDSEMSISSCQLLEKVLEEKKIEKVYYFNPVKIKEEQSDDYKRIISIFEEYLEADDDDDLYLMLPSICLVSDGKVVSYSSDLVIKDDIDDATLIEKQKEKIENIYLELIDKYIENERIKN